ncbi:DUF1120 domain-containing protein [Pseudomonas sp. NPDC098747]|uniref:DUF1120 domain-containing protein n=1 Tax=Pseudomonas sp. NPDC098747 TaxID=3364487 RepID=UPI00383A878B
MTGTITPAACNITIDGGDIDLGSISAKDLSATERTYLPTVNKNLTVQCSSATLVGINAINNTVSTDLEGDDFGLGQDANGNSYGWFNIQLQTPTLDSAPGTVLRSTVSGLTWGASNPDVLFHDATSVTSWSTSGGAAPATVTLLNQPIVIKPIIFPEKTFDTSSEITLNGSATIELVYL